jgi:hexosaminidase
MRMGLLITRSLAVLALGLGFVGCTHPATREGEPGSPAGDGDEAADSGEELPDGAAVTDDPDAGVTDAGSEGCPALPADQGLGEYVGQADALIPKPRSLVLGDGYFALTPRSAISVRAAGARAAAGVLQASLSRGTGYVLPLIEPEQEACFPEASLIVFDTDAGITADEGYRLDVTPLGVNIGSATADGFARATASLVQLFPGAIEGPAQELRARWSIPALSIDDAPQFAYRGLHLDVSRHFFSVSFVERYIDLLAAYKLNTLHLHLTDDQGWRIEIRGYPRLTEIGAWRGQGPAKYGGFYTQDEIRHIVAYASDRGVMVVPEIEMPGHASAALAAYSGYGCTSDPVQVETSWGVFPNLFCPTEDTFDFLEAVLAEVFDLFPSKYVHIGGDEATKEQWVNSAAAQSVIAREGLNDEDELETYFLRRIEAFARSRGRVVIGWDDIVADGLPTTATIMAWQGIDVGKSAAESGYDVVMTPYSNLYFDHYQADPASEPYAIGGLTTVARVYGFSPLPPSISEAAARHILGAQANLWTEYVETEAHAEYMVLPRALALAEVLWSHDPARDYVEFVSRLSAHAPHLDARGVNYARHAFTIPEQGPYGGTAHVIPGTLEAEAYDLGGESIAYHDSTGANAGGKYRMDDVDIEELADGVYSIGYVAEGEWLEYSLDVSATSSYAVSLRAATPIAGATLELQVDGVDAGEIIVPATADWNVFATSAASTLALSAGSHVLRVRFGATPCNLDWIALSTP